MGASQSRRKPRDKPRDEPEEDEDKKEEGHRNNPLLEEKKLPNFVEVVKHSKAGDTKEVEEILKEYDSRRKELFEQTDDRTGYTPLLWACRNGDIQLINLLLKSGAEKYSSGNTEKVKEEEITPANLIDERITDLQKAREKHKEGSSQYKKISDAIYDFETVNKKLSLSKDPPSGLKGLRKRELGRGGGTRRRRKRKQSA